MRPVIQQTLEACGWNPRNVPEQVACRKMVEELLDKVEEIGFLGMSDLRDAVARNQLKLGDLSNPSELLSGDRLLKTDKALAVNLPGVYRRGEVYLRELQRANSVVFGTRTGRFLSLYLALPVCGSFVILEGLEHLVNPVLRAGWDTQKSTWSIPPTCFSWACSCWRSWSRNGFENRPGC